MESLHLKLARNAHHIAGGVEESAHAEVELVVQSGFAAAVVAGGRSCPALCSGPASAVVMPGTLAVVLTAKLTHLFREKDLVEVVHLLVGASVVIFPVRVVVDRSGRIQLESLHTLIHEHGQVIHPMLLAGKLAARALGDDVLLLDAEVILLAEPESEVEAHGAQLADEEAVVHRLRVLILKPVRFRREPVVVPFLLGREVVALLHPLRLKPEHVARHVELAEAHRVVEDVELLLAHVRSEAESVGPFRQDIGTARDEGIFIKDCRHVLAHHQEEVCLVEGVDDVEPVLPTVADVEETLAGGVVVDSPAARAHHERHRNLGLLVGRPHPEEFAPVLDVVAAGAAAAVEALAVLHAEAEDADCVRRRNLVLVNLSEFPVVVADDASAVVSDLQIGVFLVDE